MRYQVKSLADVPREPHFQVWHMRSENEGYENARVFPHEIVICQTDFDLKDYLETVGESPIIIIQVQTRLSFITKKVIELVGLEK